MTEGRAALAAIIRECFVEIKACGQRAELYNIRQENGACFPISEHGSNFGSMQWHLGFAAGIQWAQMRLERQLRQQQPNIAPNDHPATRPQEAPQTRAQGGRSSPPASPKGSA